jgi:hypothetical protein
VIEQQADSKAKLSSVRILRKVTLTLLPFIGVLVVVGAVFWSRELRLQIALVVCGLLLVELGVWKSAQNILPSERKFDALRFEVEAFIQLVRQLNTAALALKELPSPEHQKTFEDIRDAMQQAVDRMADVAGKTDAEIVEGIASTVAQANHQDVDSRTVL